MLLRVRKNSQVTIPAQIKKRAHLEDGDLLEVEVRDGQIVMTPKKLVDKSQAWFWTEEWQKAEAEAQSDIRAGRTGEFESVDDLLNHLSEE